MQKRNAFDIVNTIIMLFIIIVTLYPFVYVVAISFSGNVAIMQNKVTLYPIDFNVEAYKKILSDPQFGRSYLNTIIYTLTGTFMNLFFTTTMAYPLSKKDLFGKKFFNILVAITLFIGGGMIPNFLLINKLGMYNTIWAIILPGAISTYYLIITRTAFQEIPSEIEESAKIDGANDIIIYLTIILPLSKAALSAISLFYAVGHWNSYFGPMIYLKGKEKMPLQILLKNMLVSSEMAEQNKIASKTEEMVVAESIKSASIIISTIPVIAVYPFLQKHFVKGVLIGSIKG